MNIDSEKEFRTHFERDLRSWVIGRLRRQSEDYVIEQTQIEWLLHSQLRGFKQL